VTRPAAACVLDPHSIALVGASNDPTKRGHQTLRRLLADGFPYPIYPVNPRESEVLGITSYPSLAAIGQPVDLAFIVTPAQTAPALVAEAGQAGIPAAVVIAVGFREIGAEGQRLEEALVRAARDHGVALLGPNTNGVFNVPARLNLLGTSDVPSGRLSLLCQSGNVGLALVSQVKHETAMGFSIYAGIGNEAGLRFDELLDHLDDDEQTDAIVVYAEGFRDGRAFLRSAGRVAMRTPIVLYKAGRSEIAQRSASSHTGAVASPHEVAAAALRQAGVVVVDRSDELVPVADTLLQQPPLSGAGRIAVLADGGGHATIAADALHDQGLELPELSDRTRERLRRFLPPAASTSNPVDVAGATDGDPSIFDRCLKVLVDDPGVDGVLCVGLLGGYGIRFSGDLNAAEERTVVRMATLARDRGKPLVVQSAYAYEHPHAHSLLRAANVPVMSSVDLAARCIAALQERGRYLARAGTRSSFEVLPRTNGMNGQRVLTEPEGRDLLQDAGVPIGPWVLAGDAEAAARAAEEIDAPVAMKIVSTDVVHKSDVGGVVLGIQSPAAARTAFDGIMQRVRSHQPDASIDGVLVTPMAPAGIELIVGATVDPSFGPVVTVGAGGTEVELRRDLSFRTAPIGRDEAVRMLQELQIAPLLEGFRGSKPVDGLALVELVLAVSTFIAQTPKVTELDLNPVIAHPGGADPVDVRVVVSEDREESSADPAHAGMNVLDGRRGA
jgi:acetate---CoA ligase (ADP-forming)